MKAVHDRQLYQVLPCLWHAEAVVPVVVVVARGPRQLRLEAGKEEEERVRHHHHVLEVADGGDGHHAVAKPLEVEKAI